LRDLHKDIWCICSYRFSLLLCFHKWCHDW
jgi:hypothetical protein